MAASFNLIGPGRVGRTLARLWQQQGAIDLGGIVARDRNHAEMAAAFIGAGAPLSMAALPQAQITLIATPDDAIAPLAERLAQTPWQPGAIVFHCSGALSSAVLAPLAQRGVAVASVHPLKSFADPAIAVGSFAGTWCACEGDAAALAVLGPLFDGIGARRFAVNANAKTLYHAGAVLACNDLVALMETALRSMEAAGVDRAQAWAGLRALIDGTLDNLDRMSTRDALTGPIARGDVGTVAGQVQAVDALDADVAASYRALGRVALGLTKLDDNTRAAMNAVLDAPQ